MPSTLLMVALVVGLYSAWNIGANDLANAMGTSVGSRALTLRRAIICAGICEFLGAALVGSHVTDTIRKGIIDPMMFASNPETLALGMLAALISSALLLHLLSILGMPASTTHAIVGAVTGFGLLQMGIQAIFWKKLFFIFISWVTSPLVGGIMAFVMFKFIAHHILSSDLPYAKAVKASPYLASSVVFILTLSIVYKGLLQRYADFSFRESFLCAFLLGSLAFLVTRFFFRGRRESRGLEDEYRRVEKIFSVLQVITACYVAFAHGANDVANAIGPLAAIINIACTNAICMQVQVPIGLLLLGGAGIVLGVATYGYKVIETVGRKITEITPSRGFSAEFATATTVLVCSKMGLPISTTHTLVGAVIGVGFARGIAVLNFGVIRNIITSWFITIPGAALMTVIIFKLLKIFY